MALKPLGDRVLVRRLTAATTTASGLYIPNVAVEKQLEGEVISVGDGRFTPDGVRVPVGVSVGDRVLFSSRYAGTEVLNDENLVLLREDELIAVLLPD